MFKCIVALAIIGMVLANPHCKHNEHYDDCGTACEPSCQDPFPFLCTDNCVAGCFCNEGLVRDVNGHCVETSKCLNEGHSCKKNEEFLECGSQCEPTCDGAMTMVCNPMCVQGCYCRKGFVRHQGECIPSHAC